MEKNKKILIVEDSLTMRKLQLKTLQEIGYTDVDEAVNGKAALMKVQNNDYDLILLDWAMPEMDGLSFLQELKSAAASQKIPVIMVTAESEKPKILQAVRSGAASYIIKPFDPKILKEKILLAMEGG